MVFRAEATMTGNTGWTRGDLRERIGEWFDLFMDSIGGLVFFAGMVYFLALTSDQGLQVLAQTRSPALKHALISANLFVILVLYIIGVVMNSIMPVFTETRAVLRNFGNFCIFWAMDYFVALHHAKSSMPVSCEVILTSVAQAGSAYFLVRLVGAIGELLGRFPASPSGSHKPAGRLSLRARPSSRLELSAWGAKFSSLAKWLGGRSSTMPLVSSIIVLLVPVSARWAMFNPAPGQDALYFQRLADLPLAVIFLLTMTFLTVFLSALRSPAQPRTWLASVIWNCTPYVPLVYAALQFLPWYGIPRWGPEFELVLFMWALALKVPFAIIVFAIVPLANQKAMSAALQSIARVDMIARKYEPMAPGSSTTEITAEPNGLIRLGKLSVSEAALKKGMAESQGGRLGIVETQDPNWDLVVIPTGGWEVDNTR